MPHRLDSLDGQVALITGGAGGLGREAASWLAAAGAQVVIADVSAAALERAADRLAGTPAEAKSFHYAALDVTDSAAVRALVADIESRYGRLDVLLTSHGFPRDRRLRDMADDDWNDVIGVCLTGTFLPSALFATTASSASASPATWPRPSSTWPLPRPGSSPARSSMSPGGGSVDRPGG
jgi:NAD(P)-dependent dehydrogenase (short-subunit alcohol dehydrogenase family)